MKKIRNKLFIIGLLILILLVAVMDVAITQENESQKEWVGFSCSYSGRPSKTVEQFTKELKGENYKWISKKLKSRIPAEKYMSVISLEKLDELGKYKLNAKEIKLIDEIKKSNQLVSVCSGCTYFERVQLRNMFNDEMSKFRSYWMTRNF